MSPMSSRSWRDSIVLEADDEHGKWKGVGAIVADNAEIWKVLPWSST